MSWPDLINDARAVAVDHLGVPFTYIDQDGNVTQIAAGIFLNEFVRETFGEPGLVNRGPALFVQMSDLPVDPEQDMGEVDVNGTRYIVQHPEKDGQGGVVLMLEQKR